MTQVIQTKNYFEQNAQDWVSNAYTQNDKENSIGYTRARLASSAIKKYKPGKILTICDLGCGNGHFARMLAAQGHTVYGIDQSEKMLEMARSINESGTIHYTQADISKAHGLELPQFDVITSLGVMYYFDTDNDIFSFVQKKMKLDGLYITSCRNKMFNLFPGSSSNHSALNDPQLIELLREMLSLSNTLNESSLHHFIEHCKNVELPPLVKNENTQVKMGAAEIKSELLGRQHTPQELAKTAKIFGLMVDKIWAFQPHLFSTKSEDGAKHIHKQLSEALMAFCELPISLLWSSHFLSVLRAM